METDLLFYLGGLALLDTLSPTIIGVILFLILTDNKNLALRSLTYLFTVAILYFLLGLVMLLGLNFITEAFSTIFQYKIIIWAIFIIGTTLFIASFFIPTNKKSTIPTPQNQSLFAIILIGITTFIIEAGTALPYFAAIGLLISMDIPYDQSLFIIAVYNIIMILPALLIFLGYKLFGKRIKPTLTKLRNKFVSSSHSALSWILCIVGLILIFYTIDYL